MPASPASGSSATACSGWPCAPLCGRTGALAPGRDSRGRRCAPSAASPVCRRTGRGSSRRSPTRSGSSPRCARDRRSVRCRRVAGRDREARARLREPAPGIPAVRNRLPDTARQASAELKSAKSTVARLEKELATTKQRLARSEAARKRLARFLPIAPRSRFAGRCGTSDRVDDPRGRSIGGERRDPGVEPRTESRPLHPQPAGPDDAGFPVRDPPDRRRFDRRDGRAAGPVGQAHPTTSASCTSRRRAGRASRATSGSRRRAASSSTSSTTTTRCRRTRWRTCTPPASRPARTSCWVARPAISAASTTASTARPGARPRWPSSRCSPRR